MALRLWPARVGNLARIELELAPRNAGRNWLLRSVALGAALLAGAAANHYLMSQQFGIAQQREAAQQERAQLEQGLEQARLQQRVSDAHGQELERQIDALNQRLQLSQEEVSFLRKAGNTRKPAPAQVPAQ